MCILLTIWETLESWKYYNQLLIKKKNTHLSRRWSAKIGPIDEIWRWWSLKKSVGRSLDVGDIKTGLMTSHLALLQSMDGWMMSMNRLPLLICFVWWLMILLDHMTISNDITNVFGMTLYIDFDESIINKQSILPLSVTLSSVSFSHPLFLL